MIVLDCRGSCLSLKSWPVDKHGAEVGESLAWSMSGKRVLSVLTVAASLGAASMCVASGHYVIAALFGLTGTAWLVITISQWKKP